LRDSGGGNQELSTAQQREKVAAYCAQTGLQLVRVFEDAAKSGTSTAGRDAFLELYHYLSDTPCPLVVWDLSRLARNFDDTSFYLADLRRRGVVIHTVNEALPPGLDGRLLELMITWKNARYSEDLSRNVKRGMAYVRDVLGGHHGRTPLGFDTVIETIGTRRDGSARTVRKLVPNDDMARVVRAFEMRRDMLVQLGAQHRAELDQSGMGAGKPSAARREDRTARANKGIKESISKRDRGVPTDAEE